MRTNETIKWQEEQALQWYQLIAPLLDESLDNAKRIQLRENIAEHNGLSPRTLYRYEAAYRNGRQIIYILELEGRVAPGVLKRSTMERYLYKAGFGVRQMQMYNDARKSSAKRFCKPHRMMLIQGDIKYGIKLPIGKNGAIVQTYLSSAIDDHSQYVIQSESIAIQYRIP